MSDLNLTPKQRIKAQLMYDDLVVKSMIFDMDIDIETWSLAPKSKYQEPIWITRWREKQHESDRQPEDYEGGKDER